MKTSLSNLQEISDTLSKVERMLGAEGTLEFRIDNYICSYILKKKSLL